MYETIKRIGRKVPKKPLGIFFMILGLLALVTPLTPGSWLIFVGLELLGIRYAFKGHMHRALDRFKKQKSSKKETLSD